MKKLFVLIIFFFRLFSYKATVITSVYNGGEFVKGFIDNILSQKNFDDIEFIIINTGTNQSDHDQFLKLSNFKNIKYFLSFRNYTLYETWNMAIKLSESDFITPWNIDDRRSNDSINDMAEYLKQNIEVSVVYGNIYVSYVANLIFDDIVAEENKIGRQFYDYYSNIQTSKKFEYFKPIQVKNYYDHRHNQTGYMPMWRKNIHEKFGYFSNWFTSAGDWEFFLRIAKANLIFKYMDITVGVYYLNPLGLSTRQINDNRELENKFILENYSEIFK